MPNGGNLTINSGVTITSTKGGLFSSIQRKTDGNYSQVKNIRLNNVKINCPNSTYIGAIVGSASSPSFNPNTLNIKNYNNPLTSYVYEPGSTMKIYSFMAAIEEGLYKGDETYKSGSIEVDNYNISDWNKDGWGTINFDTGFTYSSNVAAVLLGQRLGKDLLYEYYEKMGLKKKN